MANLDQIMNYLADNTDFETESIKTGITLYSFGRLRILVYVNFTPSTANYATLAAEHRPSNTAFAIGFWQSTNVFTALLRVQSDGIINAKYFTPGQSSLPSITNGTLSGTVIWTV